MLCCAVNRIPYNITVDCIWENISIPLRQITMRRAIADGTLIVGAVFWSIVVVRTSVRMCHFRLHLLTLMMLCVSNGLLLNTVAFVLDLND